MCLGSIKVESEGKANGSGEENRVDCPLIFQRSLESANAMARLNRLVHDWQVSCRSFTVSEA